MIVGHKNTPEREKERDTKNRDDCANLIAKHREKERERGEKALNNAAKKSEISSNNKRHTHKKAQ